MEKAYQISDLVSKLKARGMDVAEEAAKICVQETLAWFKESAAISENHIDDLVAPFCGYLETAALGLVDKIDGQVG